MKLNGTKCKALYTGHENKNWHLALQICIQPQGLRYVLTGRIQDFAKGQGVQKQQLALQGWLPSAPDHAMGEEGGVFV